MRARTKARELALQFLYQVDVTKENWAQVLEQYWEGQDAGMPVKAFAVQIIQGTMNNLGPIDILISKYAQNWQLSRMAVIDRNILRMGCFELVYREDIPGKVAINEAVELAKKYGDTESGKFVNGILDKICREEIKNKSLPCPPPEK